MRLPAFVLSLAACAAFVGSAEAGLLDHLGLDGGCCAPVVDGCGSDHCGILHHLRLHRRCCGCETSCGRPAASCCQPAATCCAPAPSCSAPAPATAPAPSAAMPPAAPAPAPPAAAPPAPARTTAPAPAAAAPKAADSGWINLFNGKDLTGWKVGDKEQSKIHVEDGMIVAAGPRSHVFTEREFKNFEFEAEVKTTPGSNSGLYFHSKYQEKGFPDTGYESQVNV